MAGGAKKFGGGGTLANAGSIIDHAFGKQSGSGSGGNPLVKRASIDTMQQASANPAPLSETQKQTLQKTGQAATALNIAKKQRAQNRPFVQGAETILGMLPGPISAIGTGLRIGDAMGAASEQALTKANQDNPGSVSTDKNVPGSVYGRINGMMYSNRADVPGYNGTNGTRGLGKQAAAGTEDIVKPKKKQLPTLLGNVNSNPLGSFNNPQAIT